MRLFAARRSFTAGVASLAVALILTASGTAHGQDVDYSEVVHGDPATGVVALTFDAGTEGGGSAPEILEILRERGVRVTFFLSRHSLHHTPELAPQTRHHCHET